MKRARYTLIIGLTISLLPFLGLPVRYYRLVLPIIGVILIIDALKKHHTFHFHQKNSNIEKKTITKEQQPQEDKESFLKKRKNFFSNTPILARNSDEKKTEEESKDEVSQESEFPNEKIELPREKISNNYLRLSAVMLGYKFKQESETSRLAGRIRISRTRPAETPEIQTQAKEVSPDPIMLDSDEEIEVIVDDDLIAEKPSFMERLEPELEVESPKQISETEEAIIPEITAEREEEEISSEEIIIDEDVIIDPLEEEHGDMIFSHEIVNQSLNQDLLSRIGDEIDE